MDRPELRHKLVAILAADAVGYSRLMSINDTATVAALDKARLVFRENIEANRGRVVDTAGDSVLAVFETATEAVVTALAVQYRLEGFDADKAEDSRLSFRVGVHLGDVIEKADGTVYGDGVNIAARLGGLSEPGGITVSEAIRSVVKGKVRASFDDQGEQSVKNLADPVRAWRVRGNDSLADSGVAQAAPASPRPSVPETALSLPDKPSIAVLPFTNMSGDAGQEYFTDGVTQDIVSALSRFHSLFVIAHASSATYSGKNADMGTVATQLGVRYVVSGSVRREANRVRITAQLIDASLRRHIWSENYDRVLQEIFAVQEEVTRSIVAAVAPEIARAELGKARRRRPSNLTAYEIAVRAWADACRGYRGADTSTIPLVIEQATQALAIDPTSTLALNTLSYAHWQQLFFRSASNLTDAWEKGMQAARQAIELDSGDSLGYAMKATLLQHDPRDEGGSIRYDEALDDLHTALQLNPNDHLALRLLGFTESVAGRPVEGIEHLQQALRLNPRDPFSGNVMSMLSLAYFFARDYDEGTRCALRVLAESPKMANTLMFLALNYVGDGEIEKARAAWKSARDIAPSYVDARTNGFSVYRLAADRQRQKVFLRIAAGLEDPASADALR